MGLGIGIAIATLIGLALKSVGCTPKKEQIVPEHGTDLFKLNRQNSRRNTPQTPLNAPDWVKKWKSNPTRISNNSYVVVRQMNVFQKDHLNSMLAKNGSTKSDTDVRTSIFKYHCRLNPNLKLTMASDNLLLKIDGKPFRKPHRTLPKISEKYASQTTPFAWGYQFFFKVETDASTCKAHPVQVEQHQNIASKTPVFEGKERKNYVEIDKRNLENSPHWVRMWTTNPTKASSNTYVLKMQAMAYSPRQLQARFDEYGDEGKMQVLKEHCNISDISQISSSNKNNRSISFICGNHMCNIRKSELPSVFSKFSLPWGPMTGIYHLYFHIYAKEGVCEKIQKKPLSNK